VALTKTPTGRGEVALVSRSPGRHDVMAGEPFAGPSGKVLDHLLRQNGISRDDLLITNVVLCSPPEGKVPPEAIECCAPRLKAELQDYKLILAAGTEAVHSLIGHGTIDSKRGYRIKRDGRTLIATNNPALVLRDDSTFPNLVKDFRRMFNPLPAPKMPQVGLIEEKDAAIKYLRRVSGRTGFVAADIESRGGLTHRATLVSIQFSFDGASAIVLGERQGLFKDRDFVDNHLRPFLENEQRQFIWHNGIFDTKILHSTYGIKARVDEDTLLLSYALDERGGVHELEYLLMEEFGWSHYTPPSVSSFKKTGKLVSDKELQSLRKRALEGSDKYEQAHAELENKNYVALYKYAGYDAAGTYQLFELLADRAKSEGVWHKPYKGTLLKAEDILRDMELTGMPYDYNHAAEMLETEVQPELHKLREELRALTDKALLNPASPTQMAALFYDDWAILHDMRNRPDMGRSVDASARKEITDGRFTFKGEHVFERKGSLIVTELAPDARVKRELIQQVATQYDRFQKLHKQAGTYLLSLIERAEGDPDSRIYTTFPRHATSTGRLASREPNLQNVTRTKEGLPDIRGLFYAPSGTRIVQSDFSQAELRTIAALSHDPLLRQVYDRDEDLHTLLAERFYGKDFKPEQRNRCKNMNFGVFYWQSAATFQEKHEIPEEEAQKYIDWIWQTFTTVRRWQNTIVRQIHENHYRNFSYIESPFGHRRRFYLITDENRAASYREAINFLPQNIAANLTLHACVALHREVDPGRAKLCLTVHDSILAGVEEGYVDEYSKICKEVMESRPKELLGWDIPFKADIGVGKTWASAK
jgi:uracil-DNA glycosylase family 4